MPIIKLDYDDQKARSQKIYAVLADNETDGSICVYVAGNYDSVEGGPLVLYPFIPSELEDSIGPVSHRSHPLNQHYYIVGYNIILEVDSERSWEEEVRHFIQRDIRDDDKRINLV